MSQKTVHTLMIAGVAALVLAAIFVQPPVQYAVREAAHEIRTYDGFKQAAYPGAGANCPPYAMQPVAMTQSLPPTSAGEPKPVIIKQWGVEAVSVGQTKVRITGVMGNSWADKAGLRARDVIIEFNGQKLMGMKHLQDMLAKASPEKDYKIKYLRSGRVKKGLITVGEGDMEGVTPIVPVAWSPAKSAVFVCGQCGGNLLGSASGPVPNCPVCRVPMRRTR
ncbi:MAG: PDZ domain-containing protein [Candidatus Omnitrophica bacterium]|nr:PDZ domain-containing protein [Candidatus Omnitrophota bacterium]